MKKLLKPLILVVLALAVIICVASCKKDEEDAEGTTHSTTGTVEVTSDGGETNGGAEGSGESGDNTSGSGESGENAEGGSGLSVGVDEDTGFGKIHTVK